MPSQIALLRAINVGGRAKVAMADLRAVFATLGYEDTRTVLQTGNVIFASDDGEAAALEGRLEAALADCLGLKTHIMIRTAKEWEGIINANPFPEEATSDPGHLVLMALKAKPAKSVVEALNATVKGREVVKAVGAQLYITYPDGIGRSKLTTALIEKTLGARGTGRNWNTVLKIAEAARAS